MKWIYIQDQDLPEDEEILVIWKGRIGIYYKDSTQKKGFCCICPEYGNSNMEMDEECIKKIQFWMPIPEIVFSCDIQPERLNDSTPQGDAIV